MITGTEALKIKDLLIMINEIMGNKIKISYSNKKLKAHYNITPFSFSQIFLKDTT